MKPQKVVKVLSVEETLRLAMIRSVDKQRAIELITQHIRSSIGGNGRGPGPKSPDQWYKPRKRR